MTTVSPIERLLHTEAIKVLKAQYFRSVDLQDWTAFAAVFTPNATLEVERPGGTATIVGPAAIASMVSEYLHDARSIHYGHMPEIQIHSGESASGIWSMEDRLSWPDRRYHGYGHYHEQYERAQGIWLIRHCRLVRVDLSRA